nr:hypothetical protein [Tanacetum cinerariifolium]
MNTMLYGKSKSLVIPIKLLKKKQAKIRQVKVLQRRKEGPLSLLLKICRKGEVMSKREQRCAEGSETLEQTFNILQAIVSHLEFINVEIEQDDLNQKFLTSLTPECLMYTIVWRNRDDLDTMSLDDVYNHLKVYEPEVQKKSESNSQNMTFISLANTSSGKGEVHPASVPTASNQVSTASADVAATSSKEEESAPKALMAIDGIGWDWSYMANEEKNHALVADDEALTEFAFMAKSSSSSKNKVYDDSFCSKSCKKYR